MLAADAVARHRCAVRRQVFLPRRARHPAAAPRRLAARSGLACRARPTARRWARSPETACFSRSWRRDPAKYLPDVDDERRSAARSSRIDLNRPMSEIRATLSRHPIRTRLSLTGPMIVARDIAHAKLKRAARSRRAACRDYLHDHPVYYAGPGENAGGLCVGLVRADDGRAHGLLRRSVPGGRRLAWSCWPRAIARRAVRDACKKHGGFYLGSIGGPAARLAQDCIKKVEVARVSGARNGGGLADRGRGFPGVYRHRRQGQRLLQRTESRLTQFFAL